MCRNPGRWPRVAAWPARPSCAVLEEASGWAVPGSRYRRAGPDHYPDSGPLGPDLLDLGSLLVLLRADLRSALRLAPGSVLVPVDPLQTEIDPADPVPVPLRTVLPVDQCPRRHCRTMVGLCPGHATTLYRIHEQGGNHQCT